MKKSSLTYKQSGVDYSKIDPLKVFAQKAAKKTAKNFSDTGFKEVAASRGESAYVVDCGSFYLASITECLGTKALVADETRKFTGKTYYDLIAQDTIAYAVNDVITVGARPISIHAYWATGSSEWFDDIKKMKDLVQGWKRSCDFCKVAWGGGETPTLKDIVMKEAIDLAASCVGIIKPKKRLTLGQDLKASDAIIMFASIGIQSNGLTLAREIAKKLPKGYATKISKGTIYGEALLKPTLLYSPLIQDLFDSKVDIHYMSNITGHGWRKIMRHPESLTYRIRKIVPLPRVLKFIVEKGPVELSEAYSTLNMGAGFCIFISEKDIKKVLAIAKKNKIKAYHVGVVEKGPKQVIIEPLKIVYKGKSLQLRG